MINRFEIVGSSSSRPEADGILFCDGTGGSLYQPETDLELSHWRPNHTPPEYLAGTSAEVCFKFLDKPRDGHWTVAVNNHLDIDGILSVYVLLHPEQAQSQRKTIIQAAEMGDFWGWGEAEAQRVFQGLTLQMNAGRKSGLGARDIYMEAFDLLPMLIDGTAPQMEDVDTSLERLRQGVSWVEEGTIVRKQINEHFAAYVIPNSLAEGRVDEVAYTPEFNEAISKEALLWPQVRAKWDAQRVCLVSAQHGEGSWLHDLWFPGYLWAHTAGLWQVPGMNYGDNMEGYELTHPPLLAAFEKLQQLETGKGHWLLGGSASPLHEHLRDKFPLVGRFADHEGGAATSGLTPEVVANELNGVFESKEA